MGRFALHENDYRVEPRFLELIHRIDTGVLQDTVLPTVANTLAKGTG